MLLQLHTATPFSAHKSHRSPPALRVHSAKSPVPAHNTWLASNQADAPGSPFGVLGVQQELGGGRRRYKRIGHHVEQLDWASMFEDPTKPLIIDVGCGCGRCLLLLATQQQEEHQQPVPPAALSATGANLLGVDVSVGIIDQANTWAVRGGVSERLCYVAADISSVLRQVPSYPGPVRTVAVQFPDPHYCPQRHPVTEAFVRACAEAIEPGGSVWLQSDIESTALSMRRMFWLGGGASFATHPVHYEPGASWHTGTTGANSSRGVSAHTQQESGGSARFVSGVEVGVGEQDLWSQHHDAIADVMSFQSTGDGAEHEGYNSCDAWPSAGWLVHNVWRAPTEREFYHASITRAPVFRLLLQKQSR